MTPARRNTLGRIVTVGVLLAACGLAVPPVPGREAPRGLVEQIEVHGLSRVEPQRIEGVLGDNGVREGLPYAYPRVRAAVRGLLATRQFDGIAVDTRDGAEGGVVLVLRVEERPGLAGIEVAPDHVVSADDLRRMLGEARIGLEPGGPFDIREVRKAEKALGRLLRQRGYEGARIETDIRSPRPGERSVRFEILDGAS